MIPQVRPAQLAQWFQTQTGTPVLLDVREPSEWTTASVNATVLPTGAELVHIAMGSVPQHLAQLDPARPVACLCHHGARSQRVAQFLVAQGFGQVANVAGGIDAWSSELDPSVRRY
jgi:rhodanese-related sulfurtransferase